MKLHDNEWLRQHGWKQILQIHDEVILEGPEESSEEALHRVEQDMMYPFEQPLLVDLVVDGNCERTWYEAK